MIELLYKKLDVKAIIDSVRTESSGGLDVFIGAVRNQTKGRPVQYLDFESYESMAIKELQKIVDLAKEQWPIDKIAVQHRLGKVEVGEDVVVIAVSSAHRDAAFHACRYVIDTLKQTVPIWKKEVFEDGEIWVSAHP